jgi:hypothetical protein
MYGVDPVRWYRRRCARNASCYDGRVTESLAQVLEAARTLSTDEQDALVDRVLEWRAEAERGDIPVWLSEEELEIVRRGREDVARGDIVDAEAFLDELRRGG